MAFRLGNVITVIIVGVILLVMWIFFMNTERVSTLDGGVFWLRILIGGSPLWGALALVASGFALRYAYVASREIPRDTRQEERYRGHVLVFLIIAAMFFWVSLSLYVF